MSTPPQQPSPHPSEPSRATVKESRRPAVGLCMIVRNEQTVIERCLASVTPFIDTWTIVDTGSTDDTPAKILGFFAKAGMAGELHERPWVDFGHNRTEAIRIARTRCDYMLFIDADEILTPSPGFRWPDLVAPAYSCTMSDGTIHFSRTCLVNSRLTWRYVGVLHEYLEAAEGSLPAVPLPGLAVRYTADGNRGKNPRKFLDDAAVLEKALRAEPDHPRYTYYLAQSWRDAGDIEQAIAAYRRRASLGGWDEERWHALYQVARLMDLSEHPSAMVVDAYLKAHEARPTRAEPLVWLGIHLRRHQRYRSARLFLAEAFRLPPPSDHLFVEADLYGWKRADELAVCAFHTGDAASAGRLWQTILDHQAAPAHEIERIRGNLAVCAAAMHK